MQTKIYAFLFTLLVATPAFAQYESVLLNQEKSYFGENKPLPTAQYFMLTGMVKPVIQYLEVCIFSDESKHRPEKILFQANWKRSFNETATNFSVPINYKMRENAAYDFEFRYFRAASLDEKNALQTDLIKAVDAYIDMSMRLQGRHIRLSDNVKSMVTDMNAIVNKGSELYRNRINNNFAGFSDIVRDKLRSLEELKLPTTVSIFKKDKNKEVNEALRKVVDKSIADYKQLVHNEIINFMNTDMFVLSDKLIIDKYQTERVKNSIGLNLGYGGIFPQGATGSFNNYVTAPYLGVSFPFAKEFGPKFLRKTSVTVGAFMASSLTDQAGDTYSGPLVKVPTFAALGFRPLSFLKLNVGTAFLERSVMPTDGGAASKQILVAPMVSLGVEFNLSLDLSK